jgi:hypothetical protein
MTLEVVSVAGLLSPWAQILRMPFRAETRRSLNFDDGGGVAAASLGDLQILRIAHRYGNQSPYDGGVHCRPPT